MKILFFGTPNFALPSLQELSKHYEVIVVTQPDKPAGRGLKLRKSAVKSRAEELGLLVYQPEKLADFRAKFTEIKPDLTVVVAYGKILPEWILNYKQGALNVHASLLPRYRGAAPIQRAIMANEKETGVTVQRMVEELDAGDIISVEKVSINEKDTAGSLHDKLAIASADLLIETLNNLKALRPVSQDESKVTWAPKIEKTETVIDWNSDHVSVYNLIRALNPGPGARTVISGTPVKIWEADLDSRSNSPGKVIESGKRALVIAWGGGSLEIKKIQPENKKVITGREFAANIGLRQGDKII